MRKPEAEKEGNDDDNKAVLDDVGYKVDLYDEDYFPTDQIGLSEGQSFQSRLTF